MKFNKSEALIKHSNRDLILLIIIGGMYSLGVLLSNTFVNIFLWRQTNEYMTIAMYNLSIFILQPVAFIIAGRLCKKMDRIIVLRLGIIFLCLFYITVLFLGEKLAYYNIILGSVLGIGYGFYWLAFNVLTFEITEPDTRDFFNGLMGALESFSGMIGPLVAGFIIAKFVTNIGYTTVFSLSLGLFLLAIICSVFLEKRKAQGYYHLKFVLQQLQFNRNWRNINMANFFLGFREGVFTFVITIWIFLITNSEFALGVFYLVLHSISLIGYLIISRKITHDIKKQMIFIGCLLMSIVIYLFVFPHNVFIVFLYAFMIGLINPIINVPYQSVTYDVIGLSRKAKDWRIEYVVIFECFINIGRIVSIMLFIIVYIAFGEPFIKYLLFIISPTILFVYYFMKKVTI